MPNAITRFGAALKSLVWPGGYYGPGREVGSRGPDFIPYDDSGRVISLRLCDPDAAACGPAWTNSATAIALNWIVSNFPEADLVVEERAADGEWARREDDPMVALLDDPIPSFGAFDFHAAWAGALIGALLQGNSYWYKARDRTGAVRELWPLPHIHVEPFRPDPRSPEYRYRYRVPIEGQPDFIQDFDPSEIVHFKWGIPDPCNDLKSIAPYAQCLQERITDTEGARYTSAILQNRGVPGLVAIFEPAPNGPPFTQADADAVREGLDASFTGRARGSTKVLKGPLKLESPSFKPSELALTEISRIPEARICAALGVPPMVLGLSVGDNQRTYSNLAEAERQAWRKLRAVQNRMAEALYRQLLPDFAVDRAGLRVAWDYSRVEALQEDRDAVSKRAIAEFLAGGINQNEFRAAIGLPPVDGGDDVWWTAKNPNEGATLAEPAPLRIAKGMTNGDSRGFDGVSAGLPGRDHAPLAHDYRGATPALRDRPHQGTGLRDQAGGLELLRPAGGGHDLPDDRRPMGTPSDLDALAYRVLKQFEADHGRPDPGGPGGRPQILDSRGRPLGPEGQPPRPPVWEADRGVDEEDISPDGEGDPGLAGDAAAGGDPGEPAGPDASREATGEGPGDADPALPRGGGDIHPGGAGAGIGLEPGPEGQ